MKDLGPILLLITPEDLPYVAQLKPLFTGRKTYFIDQTPAHIGEIEHYANGTGIKYVISTSGIVLNKVVDSPKHQSLDNWNGSLYLRNGITYLFINPLKQFYSVPYGKFIAQRFISKITTPHTWKLTPPFSYSVAEPDTIEDIYNEFQRALVIAGDIETVNFETPEGETYTIIRCISFSALFPNGAIKTVVIPCSEAPVDQLGFWVTWIRNFCHLKVPKVFQNGLYDWGHLLTYSITGWGYLWDTQSLFHSWLSELPKRLDFIAAFNVHNIFYWKDLAKGGGRKELFEYNARDSWATLLTLINLISEMPPWAITNYIEKFPLWVPCLVFNLEGVKVDLAKRNELIEKYIRTFEDHCSRLRKWFGPNFNPNSPQQVKALFAFYGSGNLDSSDARAVQQFALRHPINARFAGEITGARESAKILSTYLKPEHYTTARKQSKRKSKLLKHGRLFYAQNPDGTDTARLSCSEGIYWVGSQIQNQPEEVKEMYIADDGWDLFELDNTTSESFCTGYISGDENLIATLQSGQDFHAVNASKFFGIPAAEIVSPETGKVLNVPIRNLSKRTNHGANYNMQWFMLLQTMGEKNVDRAKILLKLPPYFTRRQTCEHLLKIFDQTYPVIRGPWYEHIKKTVPVTHTLTSALNWTRYCFGDPSRSKEALNSYVAHQPQNLSVSIINRACKKIYWEIQSKHPKNFRLKAQIHDSIFGQYRKGYVSLVEQARCIAEQSITVRDWRGISREMRIPVVAKIGPNWLNMHKLTAE